MKVSKTLSLAASGYTTAVAVDGYGRGQYKVIVADLTDAAGTFYVVTKTNGADDWARHPILFQAKTAGNGLVATFDHFDLCGAELGIEWERSAGGAAQTATIYFSFDR